MPAGWDADDFLDPIRNGLSHQGKLYAAPFYGESSMMMYRRDLFSQNGLDMPDEPTWGEVYEFARTLHNPPQTYGICLRGKASWGENTAFITTMANSFGARWFDEQWRPQFDQPEWRHALSFYVDLLQSYGPPGVSTNGFNETLALMNTGKCGMWVDATVAAGLRHRQRQPSRRQNGLRTSPRTPSPVADRTGSGPGHSPSPPAPKKVEPQRKNSSPGPPPKSTPSSSPAKKAGAPPHRGHANHSTATRNTKKPPSSPSASSPPLKPPTQSPAP